MVSVIEKAFVKCLLSVRVEAKTLREMNVQVSLGAACPFTALLLSPGGFAVLRLLPLDTGGQAELCLISTPSAELGKGAAEAVGPVLRWSGGWRGSRLTKL